MKDPSRNPQTEGLRHDRQSIRFVLFSVLSARAVMHPTYVQVCSRVDRGPGVGSNVAGVPPTAAARREELKVLS